MIYIFYFFAVILILLSLKSFLGGIEYLRFFKSELSKPRSDFTPFVTIIAPCRGHDSGLAENLNALIDQDYPDFEIVFVVDDHADLSVPLIKEISQKALESGRKTKLIIANRAIDSGQKVENLREAVLHAAPQSEAFVFVDSDVRPSTSWLRDLVAPLENEDIGAATGYRWFISKNRGFSSELRSAWNASIASALGPNMNSNFCWGGSMTIRRDIFEKLDIREKWRGTLSDDFAVTKAMKDNGLPIFFVPQAVTASIDDCSFREMIEFTTRQMKITRVYATKLWILSLVSSCLFNTVLIAAVSITFFSDPFGLAFFAAISTVFLVTIFSFGKSWLRLKAVSLILVEHHSELQKQFWTQNTLWLLSPAIFLYNSLAAWFSRRLVWRGTAYELKSPTETVIIAD